MTTLNTIIEEEKKNITHKYDLRYFDGSTYAVTEEFDKDLTTAMQRAYEAGQEARVDDQKTNEEIVEETFDEYVNYWSGSPKGKTHRVGLTKQELAFVLTLKDEAHKKEMEGVVRLADELEHACGIDGDKGTKQWMAFKWFRNTIRDRYLTPTKEVTEELTNHRYDPGDEKRNPMRATKEVTEESAQSRDVDFALKVSNAIKQH